MGRKKGGFNAEARQVARGKFADADEVKKLQTKLADSAAAPCSSEAPSSSADSNVLALPSKKRKFKLDRSEQTQTKLLSKKKRKQLQQLMDKKRKKEEREQLQIRLKEVQLSKEAADRMVSISAVQTRGLKREFEEERWRKSLAEEGGVDLARVELEAAAENPVKRRRKARKMVVPKKEKAAEKRPDVLGFEESSSSSSSSSSEEDEDDDVDRTKREEEIQPEEVVETEKEVEPRSKVEECLNKRPPPSPKKVAERDPASSTKPASSRPFAASDHVLVSRSASVQAAREKLPIIGEEHAVMEAVHANPVVVLAGETGSGKTTQVPQFLYEAGYATGGRLIGVTEPRRVAAMAMSKRVGEELGDASLSSYQIRFEGNTTERTRIKFMTDGVLLREMSKDFLLTKYSVIVIDEAHERSVSTDTLIGHLSRVVRLREKRKDEEGSGGALKLVIMSATLRVDDFCRPGLFRASGAEPKPPCIKVEGRQFKVSVHHSRVTPDDYVRAALEKTAKIHMEKPEGAILVFVTGQQEVNYLVRKLRQLFPAKKGKSNLTNDKDEDEEVGEALKKGRSTLRKKRNRKSGSGGAVAPPGQVNLDRYRVVPLDEIENDADRDADADADLEEEFADEDGFDRDLRSLVGSGRQPLHCLPLYSLLSGDRQRRIFEPPPDGHRTCVVATNVAETSLTIPGVKYVVDTGKCKEKVYDKLTGVSTFFVNWVSRASAQQRAGRAGRQGEGECHRLYSTAVMQDFVPFAVPDILKRPVDDLVLQMQAMGLTKVRNFPFPTPPDDEQLAAAEKRLWALGALSPKELKKDDNKKKTKKETEFKVTELGQSMNLFPVSPCFGKMLALSEQQGMMAHTIALVSALSVQEVLAEKPVGREDDDGQNKEASGGVVTLRKMWAGRGNCLLLGDPMVLLQAVCGAPPAAKRAELESYCVKYALRHKAMVEIQKLRRQLTREVNLLLPHLRLEEEARVEAPDDSKAALLRQIVLAGMANNLARRVTPEEETEDAKSRAALRFAYRCDDVDGAVHLHARSVFVLKGNVKALPEWIVYQDRFETEDGKCVVRGVTGVEAEWIPLLCKNRCTFTPLTGVESEPTFDSETGRMMRKCHVTLRSWILDDRAVPYPDHSSSSPAAAGTAESARYFARFLLDPSSGACPKLAPVLEGAELLCAPSSFVTRTHQGPAATRFLRALEAAGVDSREKLEAALREDGDFLREETKGLLPKYRHPSVDEIWPPI